MRILITGVSGMLGKDVAAHFLQEGKHEIAGICRNPDATQLECRIFQANLLSSNDIDQVLTAFNPECIIHCAANVNIKDCEANKEDTYALHVESTALLASHPQCKRFIYVSTDSVFDGVRGNYGEKDQTAPQNYYAVTKQLGETAALTHNQHALVARVNIYGYNTPLKNSLFEWGYKSLKNGNAITGFDDVYFNALYTRQVADVMESLIGPEFDGLIHLGTKDKISKYAFLHNLAQLFGFDNTLIAKSSIADFPEFSNRPRNTTLNVDRLKEVFGIGLDFQEGLNRLYRDFIKEQDQ